MPEMTKSQVALLDYLKELNFEQISPIIPDEVAVKGAVVTDGVTFDTIISIPAVVPPAYPTFHLLDSDLMLREAHIERPRRIKIDGSDAMLCRTCIRDDRDKFYDASPVELLRHLYNDYVGLCTKFARGEFDSKTEMFREFDSYWCNDVVVCWHMSDIPHDRTLLDEIAIENLQPIPQSTKSIALRYYIATDNVEEVVRFARSAVQQVLVKKAPYIDIGDTMPLPLPYTYADLVELLKKTGHLEYLKKVRKQATSDMIYIGFDLEPGVKHVVACRMKPPVPIKGQRAKKNAKVNPLRTLFNPIDMSSPFEGAHINLIDHAWLMRRGGNENGEKLAKSRKHVAVVGCGSVGSTLASKLAKSGIRDFILIDPQSLSADNIGRHQLGMSNVGDNKARALARHLESQFIGLEACYQPYGMEHPESEALIQDADIVVTAIGGDAPAVEPWLADLAIRGEIGTVVTCWLEADAVSGHALRVSRDDAIDFNDVCNRLNLIEEEYALTLLESEVGCNSSFMPYGFVDADTHINRIAHFVLSLFRGADHRAMTSVGDPGQHTAHFTRLVQPWSFVEFSDETLPL